MLLSAVALVLSLPFSRGQAQSVACRTADSTTSAIISHVKAKIAATGAEADSDRVLFGIPVVPDSEIFVITDVALCTRLAQALGDYYELKGFARPALLSLYAVRLGTRSVVHAPGEGDAGEFRTFYIFDAQYQHAGGWSGP